MKAGIHPEYNEVTIECVCGAKYETRSTAQLQKIDICASCHPFYTGQQKTAASGGRVDKFKKRFGALKSAK